MDDYASSTIFTRCWVIFKPEQSILFGLLIISGEIQCISCESIRINRIILWVIIWMDLSWLCPGQPWTMIFNIYFYLFLYMLSLRDVGEAGSSPSWLWMRCWVQTLPATNQSQYLHRDEQPLRLSFIPAGNLEQSIFGQGQEITTPWGGNMQTLRTQTFLTVRWKCNKY